MIDSDNKKQAGPWNFLKITKDNFYNFSYKFHQATLKGLKWWHDIFLFLPLWIRKKPISGNEFNTKLF